VEADKDLQGFSAKRVSGSYSEALRTLCTESEIKYDPFRREGGDVKLHGFD